MNYFVSLVLSLFLFVSTLPAAYKDYTHYSPTFAETRSFRVWTGSNFDTTGAKHYPVIYYCHGCLGTYQGDQYNSYSGDGDYVHPYCKNGCVLPIKKPFNADFQMFTDSQDVIVVQVDGNMSASVGCKVWYPYQMAPGWQDNEYDFSKYIRELFHTVDSILPTLPYPQYRAVTGLSMGGHSALWLGASNPHLFRSVSHFCHSPTFQRAGKAPYQSQIDVTQLWRNFRGVSTRSSANNGDYIYQYTQQMGVVLEGAGFENEYHEAVFWRHWAADLDSQFLFHMKTFGTPKPVPACFSYISFYPSFDVWGLSVSSAKNDSGWIYLRDVTQAGLGFHTRYWLPFGRACIEFPCTLTTAPKYRSGASYAVTRYDYRSGAFTTDNQIADSAGALTLAGKGGMGEEMGIAGPGIADPAFSLLMDTLNENIYIRNAVDTALAFRFVNLSDKALSDVAVQVSSDNPFITVVNGIKIIRSVPAGSVIRIDSVCRVRGRYADHQNIGYLKIRYLVHGIPLEKEQILQLNVCDDMSYLDSSDIKVFDGRSESVSILKSSWGYSNSVSSEYVTEGTGDGDGVIDSGEVFSIWVRLAQGWAGNDRNTWHPVVPLNGMEHPDVCFVDRKEYGWNRCRNVLSAMMRLNRMPSEEAPMELALSTELMNTVMFPGSDSNLDAHLYRYFRLKLPLSMAIGTETRGVISERAWLRNVPNPFNPDTRIEYRVPGDKPVVLTILDASGRKVREFTAAPGLGSLAWDKKDGIGRPVSAGVYVIRLVSGQFRLQTKAVLLP